MTQHQRLILRKIEHLKRMAAYLAWSQEQITAFVPISDWSMLSPEQHEALAAFRLRFSELQEQIGKTMRAVAIEEEENYEPFGAVLSFMEKLGILDSAMHWKLIRELRNAINHEYEDNPERLTEFFTQLAAETPVVMGYAERLIAFCKKHYPTL
ncbi:MAG: hypothetical protein Q8M20_16750 [Rhodocyclaceae bacterium]|nr:hypothetical protein [Rhodocyclaceae bacterium]MDZ4214760.1 hypothetical protein [Rhodocyclaceae bacterium]